MINETVYNELIEKYTAYYGKQPEVVSYAPGRIEVLGNHTDYNEGYVFSAAINYGTFFAISRNDKGVNRIVAGDLMHEVTFPLTGATAVTEDTWANYVIGTVMGLNALKAQDTGFDAMFLGNVPMGFGLSSSAAFRCKDAYGKCPYASHKLVFTEPCWPLRSPEPAASRSPHREPCKPLPPSPCERRGSPGSACRWTGR